MIIGFIMKELVKSNCKFIEKQHFCSDVRCIHIKKDLSD